MTGLALIEAEATLKAGLLHCLFVFCVFPLFAPCRDLVCSFEFSLVFHCFFFPIIVHLLITLFFVVCFLSFPCRDLVISFDVPWLINDVSIVFH